MLQDERIREEWTNTQREEGELYYHMIKKGSITLQDKTLHFQHSIIGERPPHGYTLIFGLHGGGGCPKETNDQQYKNHLALYHNYLPPGVIWIALRSCQEASDMWWKAYIPEFFAIIIRGFVLKGLVDPRKVFLTGYSAGGDGIYHLGPMMADWLAGAAMMAGHPNGVELLNVRNIAFSIQVGGQDAAYDRNKQAQKYIDSMRQLSKQYGGFSSQYSHVFDECGHWMSLKDACIFGSFLKEVRNPYPNFILFQQHPRIRKPYFYYLGVDPERHKQLIIVHQKGNQFHIESERMPVTIYLNHLFVDFSQEVRVFHNKELTANRKPTTNFQVVAKSIEERMDPDYIFQDFLVSVPVSERAPLEFNLAEIALPATEHHCVEPAAVQEQRRRQKSDICCRVM